LDPIWDTIEFTDSEREKILDISKSTSWDNEINDKEYELSQINSQILELDEIINPSTPSPIPSYKNDSQLTLTPIPSMSPESSVHMSINYNVSVKEILRNFAVYKEFIDDKINSIIECRIFSFTIDNLDISPDKIIYLDVIPPEVREEPIENDSIISFYCKELYKYFQNGIEDDPNFGPEDIYAISIYFESGTNTDLNITIKSTFTKLIPLTKNDFTNNFSNRINNNGYTVIFNEDDPLFENLPYTIYKIKSNELIDNKYRYLKLN
jgi:hypothetical protein